jgi:hypothetical protein
MRNYIVFLFVFVITLFSSCDNSNTIKHPITGQEIEVAKKDFTNAMTKYEAQNACESLGEGWRLPTEEELIEIGKTSKNLIHGVYWARTADGNVSGFGHKLDNPLLENEELENFNQQDKAYVRAVRPI